MSRFIETIKILDGKIFNLQFHNERFNLTRKNIFNLNSIEDISEFIKIPEDYNKGLVKCRILYSKEIEKVEFSFYKRNDIKSLKLVIDNDISYSYKSENRETINNLFSKRRECDDILIVKNNLIAESSYCNVAFFDGTSWLTPRDILLKGTKRSQLLKDNKIIEKRIKIDDLESFHSISLFNAFIDLGELIIPVDRIHH